MYQCPKCNERLIRQEHSFTCVNHHNFDIAKEGYVNLLLGNKRVTGDQADMVKARTVFLSHGYYEPLRSRIVSWIQKDKPHTLIDAGCGQGYYTNELALRLPDCEVYGFDLSKYALKEASRYHSGAHYAVAGISHLPMASACADMILSIFAPIYEQEFFRLLKKNGYLLRIGPGTHHLWELKQVLYEQPYLNEPCKAMMEMKLIHEEELTYEVKIEGQSDLFALFSMTPYAYRTPKASIERLKKLKQLKVQLHFHMEMWQK